MLIFEFLDSSLWTDIRSRVLATFGLAGAGTAASAIPMELSIEQSQAFIDLEYLIRVFTLVSYILSAVVAITVIWRFVYWLIDRKKTKKINKE